MLPQKIRNSGSEPLTGPSTVSLTAHLVGAKQAGHIIGGKLYGRKIGGGGKRKGIQGMPGSSTGSTKSQGKLLGNSTAGSGNANTSRQPPVVAVPTPKAKGPGASPRMKFLAAFNAAKATIMNQASQHTSIKKGKPPAKAPAIPKPGFKGGGID